ncbi:hypothetical protein ACSW8S_15780 (plasmid) [Clostridium perfringens]
MPLKNLKRYVEEGTSAYREGNFKKSVELYEKAIHFAEENTDRSDLKVIELYSTALYNMAVSLIKLKEYSKSREVIKKYLPRLDIDVISKKALGNILYNMAFSCYKENKVVEGYVYLKKYNVILGEDRDSRNLFVNGFKDSMGTIITDRLKELLNKK